MFFLSLLYQAILQCIRHLLIICTMQMWFLLLIVVYSLNKIHSLPISSQGVARFLDFYSGVKAGFHTGIVSGRLCAYTSIDSYELDDSNYITPQDAGLIGGVVIGFAWTFSRHYIDVKYFSWRRVLVLPSIC